MRCTCCNRILFRVTGYRKLPDGTRVEEDFCNVCRDAVRGIENNEYASKEEDVETLLNDLVYNGVTPVRTPNY